MSEFPASLHEPDATTDPAPVVVGFEENRADDLLAALASETARDLFGRLQDKPTHAATLADHTDTSVQNVHYHLERLEAAGAVEVVGSTYSAKGREMDVYGSTAEPLVFVSGGADTRNDLVERLSTLLGALGLLALGSVAVQALLYPGGATTVGTGGQYGIPPLTNVTPPVGLLVFLAGLVLLAGYAVVGLRESKRLDG